jgi:polynucleotide 5'-kinase involved in rRNA processing
MRWSDVNWDAVGAIVEILGLILALIVFFNIPALVRRVRRRIRDQKVLEQAEAQADKDRGIREVVLEHKVNDFLTLRNIARIDSEGKILELRGSKGNAIWQVGQKVPPESYREI